MVSWEGRCADKNSYVIGATVAVLAGWESKIGRGLLLIAKFQKQRVHSVI